MLQATLHVKSKGSGKELHIVVESLNDRYIKSHANYSPFMFEDSIY